MLRLAYAVVAAAAVATAAADWGSGVIAISETDTSSAQFIEISTQPPQVVAVGVPLDVGDVPRFAATATVGNFTVATGGLKNELGNWTVITDQTVVFNPASNSSAMWGNLNIARRGHMMAVVRTGVSMTTVVCGGSNDEGAVTSCERLAAGSGEWAMMGDMPEAVLGAVMLGVDDELLIVGGLYNGTTFSNHAWLYRNGLWRRIADLPDGLFEAGGYVLPHNGWPVVCGGIRESDGAVSAECYAYDKLFDVWWHVLPMLEARAGHAMVYTSTIGQAKQAALVVGGIGQDFKPSQTLEIYFGPGAGALKVSTTLATPLKGKVLVAPVNF